MVVLSAHELREKERQAALDAVLHVDRAADAREALVSQWGDGMAALDAGLTRLDIANAIDLGLTPDEAIIARRLSVSLADYARHKDVPDAERTEMTRRRILRGMSTGIARNDDVREALRRVYGEGKP